jgi:hypothetical protein
MHVRRMHDRWTPLELNAVQRCWGLGCHAELAVHNPAARRIPAKRTAAPATRPMIAGQSALCIVAMIFEVRYRLR